MMFSAIPKRQLCLPTVLNRTELLSLQAGNLMDSMLASLSKRDRDDLIFIPRNQGRQDTHILSIVFFQEILVHIRILTGIFCIEEEYDSPQRVDTYLSIRIWEAEGDNPRCPLPAGPSSPPLLLSHPNVSYFIFLMITFEDVFFILPRHIFLEPYFIFTDVRPFFCVPCHRCHFLFTYLMPFSL